MTIDLSQLPPPDAVESLDYEAVYQELRANFASLYPDHSALLESDPAIKLLELAAYRELQLRARINDAARACMLSSATGADLDQLAANLGVARLIRVPGDPTATPPVPPVYESDAALRSRAVTALEGFPAAGPVGAYKFHARSASGDVADVSISSPAPGTVSVAVLSYAGDGVPSAETLAAVRAALNDEKVRPLTDTVKVVAANVFGYGVRAVLHVEPGPSAESVLAAARDAVQAYAESESLLGGYVALTGLAAALHQPGVRRVEITSPTADLQMSADQAARLQTLELSVEVAA